MQASIDQVRRFWDENPCGSNLSTEENRKRYFIEVESTRYQTERHIPEVARFQEFHDRDILEIGCGIATDGLQFAKHGARYTGIDLSPASVAIATERFGLYQLEGRLEVANAEKLAFPDESFDHVYSFGVIHHSPDTQAIVREIYRVLRAGGSFCIMVYNRSSINYHVEIMALRRLFRLLLRPGFMTRLISRLTGLDRSKLEGHRQIMAERPRLEKQEWLNMNTDGPWCPLAKVYNAREGLELFEGFDDVKTEVWHFDRSHWPFIGRLIPDRLHHRLGRTWGWHRTITGRKPVNRPTVESGESRAKAVSS